MADYRGIYISKQKGKRLGSRSSGNSLLDTKIALWLNGKRSVWIQVTDGHARVPPMGGHPPVRAASPETPSPTGSGFCTIANDKAAI